MSAPCSTLNVPQKQLALRGPDIKPDIAIKPGGSKRNEEFQRRLLITAQHTHQHTTKLTPPQSHPDHDRIFDQKRLEWMAVGWTYLAMIAPACMEDPHITMAYLQTGTTNGFGWSDHKSMQERHDDCQQQYSNQIRHVTRNIWMSDFPSDVQTDARIFQNKHDDHKIGLTKTKYGIKE